MTENQIRMIASRLDRIEERVNELADAAVTWRVLFGVVGTITAAVAAGVTVGNALWG